MVSSAPASTPASFRSTSRQHARGVMRYPYDPSTRQLLHRYKLPLKAKMRITRTCFSCISAVRWLIHTRVVAEREGIRGRQVRHATPRDTGGYRAASSRLRSRMSSQTRCHIEVLSSRMSTSHERASSNRLEQQLRGRLHSRRNTQINIAKHTRDQKRQNTFTV